ncbi:xanthine dehydrogenase accessory factor [Thermosporothrix hazakensis]|jgi:xanthine dehydrogenase accessory factor|uniref:Xanthine dehydrogenase accessory factor n=1 Tax=Thermosporothrix hazakensis TaxID=644383 RepID=A0A326U3D7_THEHA|nr:XdhC/CoxI family protein [Thermosporothrix hazakensis]PZW25694.1 xanthine dehydrogenase accessory factor [Thermosporothrix hazakensis]GCE48189.1 xanthine dehydrogenase accessory factor [Thermosporothrix hazakensis]
MNALPIYEAIQEVLRQGERVAVATVVKTSGATPCTVGSKMVIRADGSTEGTLAGPITDQKVVQLALEAMREERTFLQHVHLDADQGEAVGSCGATLEIFFEVLQPQPRLIIAGAGYVAQALARQAISLGFHIVVVDDRRDLADPKNFGEQVQLTFGDIPETIRTLAQDTSSWIVIVTRGHHLDKDALRAALETRASYIGMIGSPSKVKHIFKDLLNEGVSRERLAAVHAPIGLDLGAETPDEIALSIAAEMVMLRRKGTGAQLKTIHRLLEEEALV